MQQFDRAAEDLGNSIHFEHVNVTVPDQRLGVVVLTNQEETGAHSAVAYSVLDRYLGAAPVDWVAAFQELAKIEKAGGEAALRARTRARGTRSGRCSASEPKPPCPGGKKSPSPASAIL